jgi:hypothetical protein
MKKAERGEFNNSLKAAAFTAWRFEIVLSGLFGGQGNMTFTDYAERMGLLTEEEKKQNAALKKLEKLTQKHQVAAAIARADEIAEMDRENARRSAEKRRR